MIKKQGKLIIYSGCMFSGKTDALIEKTKKLKNKKILIFKLKISSRNNILNLIESRNNKKLKAISILNWKEIKNYYEENKDRLYAIVCDEVQFFSIDFVDFVDKLLDEGINFYLAGLDRGFSDHNLPVMNKLFSFADKIFKFTAWCGRCGKIANKTQKIDINGNPIKPNIKEMKDFVGGKYMYEPRCRKCFVKFSWNDNLKYL